MASKTPGNSDQKLPKKGAIAKKSASKPPIEKHPQFELLEELHRITCDLIWIKKELKIHRLMLESLGARTELTAEELEAINQNYVHDDAVHITRPGSACDNG
jgi:hypothetical protein